PPFPAGRRSPRLRPARNVRTDPDVRLRRSCSWRGLQPGDENSEKGARQPVTTNPKPRVLSGMRSTGKLHLGNYVGALENWVKLQEEYDCFFFIADWHALTTDYADTSRLKENSVEVLLDWLAAGLDPAKCVMFIQSHVPAHAELHLLLSMITPLGWLERVPTYKEQKENIKEKDL